MAEEQPNSSIYTAGCDIVIPVYNALSQTSRCIRSVLAHSSLPFRLVVVNDASDAETSAYLRRAAASDARITLLENEKNLGFLHTANRGLFHGLDQPGAQPLFKVVLNSDTVVTKGWLESFLRCFESDPMIGLATPVSNNAENLSLSIPPGFNLDTLAALLRANRVPGEYPDIATAIGFCMGVRTSIVREIGAFDEVFAPGYAEDSDYHFKVLCGAYRSVLLTDSFIYHESHASFSEKKQALVQRNRPIFDQRWSTIYHNELAYHDSLEPLARITALARSADASAERKHDVLFLLPTAKLFGGVIVVYEIVNRLIERGIDANVIVLGEPSALEMDLLFSPYFVPDGDWRGKVPAAKLYAPTHFETTPYAFEAAAQHPGSKLVYLIQGYESWFPGATIEEVVHTYRAIPNRVVVSGWLEKMVARWGCESARIPNGVDTVFFYPPEKRESADNPALLVMLREDPQGGWRLAFDLIRRLKEARPALRVIAVGNLVEHPQIRPLCSEAHPSANRKLMRELYRRSDIFLDCSMVQGFGLMGLEAMSSGCAAILAKTGGVAEYSDEHSAVLCELGDAQGMYDAAIKLIDDRKLLARFQEAGRTVALRFDWESSADRYLGFLRSVIDDGAPLTAENHSQMSQFLFKRMLRAQENARHLEEAKQALSAELGGERRPAGEIFRLLARPDLLEALTTTKEGVALMQVYERARAVAGIGLPALAEPLPGILGAVVRALPNQN